MAENAISKIVLVVEDEPMLRIGATTMLEDAGFDVVEAANANEAIDILERRSDIRLVFSDINMPHDEDGLKLAACIRDRWPPIEIVLTSGHTAPELSKLPARCVFVPKPYKAERIIEILRGFVR